jgi:hypothetical protein
MFKSLQEESSLAQTIELLKKRRSHIVVIEGNPMQFVKIILQKSLKRFEKKKKIVLLKKLVLDNYKSFC